jgi:hypothetical protein
MVTYDDEPVPYGEIIFEPDAGASHAGPASRVIIQQGAYSTKDSKVPGMIGGPMLARIIGFDGQPEGDGGTLPHGAPLFDEYVEKVELPMEETTQDFEVPVKD